MNYDETPEFSRELKRFAKKWRTLPADIATAKQAIEKLYIEQEGVNLEEYRGFLFSGKRATTLEQTTGCEVVKMRLDCAALGNKNLLRLVFIFIKTENGVLLVELYSKNERSREDAKRIKEYLVKVV
jgi:hypothetical protein